MPGAGWDPEDPASGDAWENQALFDHAGRLPPAARELRPWRAGALPDGCPAGRVGQALVVTPRQNATRSVISSAAGLGSG